ncbi:MAG: hypothetical protein LBK22_01660 [Tannerella sp.]|nr:hypothetical protein [Tannerella sp.]
MRFNKGSRRNRPATRYATSLLRDAQPVCYAMRNRPATHDAAGTFTREEPDACDDYPDHIRIEPGMARQF